MLTNKQIAITRLVDAKLLGYAYLEINNSTNAEVLYLRASGIRDVDIYWRIPPSMNICALKKEPSKAMYVTIRGYQKYVPILTRLPMEIGPELIEKYYHFLTYNP
jgi:hypothetical protein